VALVGGVMYFVCLEFLFQSCNLCFLIPANKIASMTCTNFCRLGSKKTLAAHSLLVPTISNASSCTQNPATALPSNKVTIPHRAAVIYFARLRREQLRLQSEGVVSGFDPGHKVFFDGGSTG
jgi:hypothetical protein